VAAAGCFALAKRASAGRTQDWFTLGKVKVMNTVRDDHAVSLTFG
jgi:hypothetical protein